MMVQVFAIIRICTFREGMASPVDRWDELDRVDDGGILVALPVAWKTDSFLPGNG